MNAQAQPFPSPLVTDVAIIGAGFGGLGMAIQLKKQGHDDFLIFEKGRDIGGTWRDNHYPGCACDVQSHLYSYSFEGKPDWSQRYAGWREIQDYIQHCANKYDLHKQICFDHEVVSSEFDEQTGQWTLIMANGRTVIASNVVLATGPLHHPNIPAIDGIDRFQGKTMHSARWDDDYDLTNKTVISIGTGGSAIQYAPEIAEKVKKLYVLQRTPAWVIPRDERRYSELRKRLFARFPILRKLHRARLYLTNESRVAAVFNPWVARLFQRYAAFYLKRQIKDPELARKLTPDYTIGCKRVLISNRYYPMFNRDNVELVDTEIDCCTAEGLRLKSGEELKADVIIFGTGFITDPRIYMQNFVCKGNDAHCLQEDWKDGAEAYYGTTMSHYPNFFQLVGPNTALGHNSVIFMIEAQVTYILACLKEKRARGAVYMDLKPEVQKRFNEEVQSSLQGTVWTSGCKSWYQQADGKNVTIWPHTTLRFKRELAQINADDYNWVCRDTKTSASDLETGKPLSNSEALERKTVQ